MPGTDKGGIIKCRGSGRERCKRRMENAESTAVLVRGSNEIKKDAKEDDGAWIPSKKVVLEEEGWLPEGITAGGYFMESSQSVVEGRAFQHLSFLQVPDGRGLRGVNSKQLAPSSCWRRHSSVVWVVVIVTRHIRARTTHKESHHHQCQRRTRGPFRL